jgi:hypothetical protein
LEKELLSQKQKLRSSTNNTPVVVPIYSTDTLTKTKNTLKAIQNEKASQQRMLAQEESART